MVYRPMGLSVNSYLLPNNTGHMFKAKLCNLPNYLSLDEVEVATDLLFRIVTSIRVI